MASGTLSKKAAEGQQALRNKQDILFKDLQDNETNRQKIMSIN